jgi:hypothetical protein
MKFIISILLFVALSLNAPIPCFAQNFKIGDNVQCRPMGSQWYSGKVTGLVNGGYKVLVDGHEYTVPDDEHSGSSRIKPGGGEAGNAAAGNGTAAGDASAVGTGQDNSGSRVQTEGTIQGERPCIDCSAGGPAGKNGDSPPVEALKRLLQCIWEKPALPGSDGAVTVAVRALTPTGKRLNGDGQRDTGRRFTDPLTSNPSTVIYMFDGSYVKKTFYRYRTQIDDTTHQVFEAFVGTDGKWHLQHASGPYSHTESSVKK